MKDIKNLNDNITTELKEVMIIVLKQFTNDQLLDFSTKKTLSLTTITLVKNELKLRKIKALDNLFNG